PCSWPAWEASAFCVTHAAQRGDVAAQTEMAERGRSGIQKRYARAVAGRRRAASLRSMDDLLTELERVLVRVEHSGQDAAHKAQVTAKIVSEARAALPAAQLESENRELRKLLVERHPELKRHLGSCEPQAGSAADPGQVQHGRPVAGVQLG